jgi:hypothetical protein
MRRQHCSADIKGIGASYSDVVVIRALQQLHAREAIPALELLLNDYDHSHVDDLISVAEAAQQAIVRIQSVAPR